MLKRMLLVTIPLLASCQAIEQANEEADLAYFPPVGSVWVLEKKVVAPRRTLNLLIIDGKVFDSFFRWDNYKPSCSLDFKTTTSEQKTIKPTRFVITRVDTREETIDSTIGNFKTIMYVTSADNPDVVSITCQNWNSYGLGAYVPVKEMREATRGIMTLEIKGEKNEQSQNKNG